jgi:peptide/nickel transport system substrate-binding protein
MKFFRSFSLVAWVACVFMATSVLSAEKTMRVGTAFLGPNRGHAYQGITMPAMLPLNAVYDTLTMVAEDGSVGPSLALSWQSEDAITWRFTLREGVKFSNGVPFTADAIVRSVEHMRSSEAGMWTISTTLYQVVKARALNDYTVEVELNQRDALFPIHAAVWRIPEPESWETMPRPDYESSPVGTGPFVVERWGEVRVDMRAFTDSWRAPKLDGLSFIEIPDQTARLQAILSDAVDLVVGLGPDDADFLESDGGQLVLRDVATVQFLAFLTVNGGSVVDPRVRLALNHAVDREAINTTLLSGKAKPLSQLAYPGAFGHDPDMPPYAYDPDLARSLLADAGYPDGLDLVASVASRGANDLLFFQQVALDLAKVGVNVEVRGKPQYTNMQDLFFGKTTGDLISMIVRGPDPVAAYRHRVCQGMLPDRFPYHCDEKLLPLLQAARSQISAEAALPFYRAILAHERENPPGIILWQGVDFDGLSAKVTGYAPVQDVMNFSDLDLVP